MQKWISEAENLAQIPKDPSLPAKKSALQKIFGSNLILLNQKVSGTAHPVYAAVAAAREKLGTMDVIQLRALVYDFARTYFARNPNP